MPGDAVAVTLDHIVSLSRGGMPLTCKSTLTMQLFGRYSSVHLQIGLQMKSTLGRRVAAVAGGSAITAMVVLTASCAKEEQKAPETSTTTTTTTTTSPAAPASPTEKAPRLDPNGPNPFSPTVLAPPAPTAVPGDN
jgi:type IV secretory pathway VirB10-like protein